jgi:hypothetical protein
MRAARDRPATLVVVVDEATELVLGRLDARAPRLELIDLLARLELATRRRGWTLRIRDAPPELRGLIELIGLAGVLGLEPQRQPELGEQLREDVVVQRGDPPA